MTLSGAYEQLDNEIFNSKNFTIAFNFWIFEQLTDTKTKLIELPIGHIVLKKLNAK